MKIHKDDNDEHLHHATQLRINVSPQCISLNLYGFSFWLKNVGEKSTAMNSNQNREKRKAFYEQP